MHGYLIKTEEAGLTPWPPLEDEGVEILEGDPKQSGRVDWGDEAGPMAVGVWECTPGKMRLVNGFSELCTVQRGRVTVTAGDGSSATYGPGDTFFIAEGEASTWEVHETMRKAFFLHIAGTN